VTEAIVQHSQIRFWLIVYLAIEFVVLISLVQRDGIFFHAGLDYLPSYAAAEMLIDGGRKDLYDTFLQWQRQQPVLERYDVGWQDRMLQPYVAPPLLALLSVPLLVLTPLAAWMTWSGINLVSVVAAVVALARRLRLEWSMVAFIVLGSFPLFYTILLGQVEGILFLAMAIFVLELRRGNEVRAALALSVLALKPQILIAPLVYVVATGHRRTFFTTAVAGAVQLVVCVLLVGVSGMREYIQFGRQLSVPEGTAATNVLGMVNLRAMVVRAFPTDAIVLQNVTIVTVSVALLAIAAYLWWRLGRDALLGPGLALLMTTTLLTSYHALYHTAIFATLGVVFLLEYAYRESDFSAVERLIGVSWLFFAFGPLLPFLVVVSSRVPAVISTVGVLLLWGFALRGVLAQLPATAPAQQLEPGEAEHGP
jgi:hypothetical protein